MPPKFMWRCPMTQICIFGGPQTAKKWCKTPHHFGGPKCPKSHLGVSNDQNLYFGGPKVSKTKKIVFVPNVPQKSIDQNLHFLLAKKYGKKMPPKNVKICCSKFPQKSVGSVQWPKFAFFCGPKLLKKGAKNPTFFWSQMPPKVIRECPVTKICTFLWDKNTAKK